MYEVFDYIFGTLKSTEMTMRNVQKTLRYQRNFNHNITVLACATTVCIVMNELSRQEQNKKIKKLECEIEELKRSEGE